MLRRIPILPSMLVLAAVAFMIRLGFWQLDRLHEKQTLLASYAVASSDKSEATWPRDAQAVRSVLYRHGRITCATVTDITARAGRSAAGEAGLAIVATCSLPDEQEARIVLGWVREPIMPTWRGGEVQGIIAPGPRLVADPPLAGLEASARPDPSDITNNHFSYAMQWFLFAATALVIYALALWKRLAGQDMPR